MRHKPPSKEDKLLLLKSLECLIKKEIEWSYDESESDDWSKLHDHIRTLKQKYI